MMSNVIYLESRKKRKDDNERKCGICGSSFDDGDLVILCVDDDMYNCQGCFNNKYVRDIIQRIGGEKKLCCVDGEVKWMTELEYKHLLYQKDKEELVSMLMEYVNDE
jgi:hypothetical protein